MDVDDNHSLGISRDKTERLLRHDPEAKVTFDVIYHAAKSRGNRYAAKRLEKLLHQSNGICVTENILKISM